MTAPQFWTIVLAVAVLVAAVVLGRRVMRRMASGRSVSDRLGGMRDGLRRLRGPVSLDVLPHTLVDQAVRAARPIPGGRALPTRYNLRCGTDLYTAAYPYQDEIADSFRDGVAEVAARQGWKYQPPAFVVELDESLPPGSYRFDSSFPGLPQPAHRGKVTDFFQQQPAPPRPGRTATPPPPHDSGWNITAPGGADHRVPVTGDLTVGAAAGCTIVVANHYVSGVHVTFTTQGPNLLIRDGGAGGKRSTNGTSVNGHPVKALTLTPTGETTTVMLGPEVKIQVHSS